MSALITGGFSKVIIKLAEVLLENGRSVVLLLDNSNELVPSHLLNHSSLTLLNVSSVNENGVRNAIEHHKIETVFDGSLTTSRVGLEPIRGAKTLLLGITSILDAIRKSFSPPSLVLISGEQVYGNSETRVETQPLEPVTFVGSAQMSVEALAHSYAVSYRIPVVIGRLPTVLNSSDLGSLPVGVYANVLPISDAVRGLLSIENLANSDKPADVFNIANSLDYQIGNLSETRVSTLSNAKILSETNWRPSDISSLTDTQSSPLTTVAPAFLVYGRDSELKNQFLELLKLDGFTATESSIVNLQEASDKAVIEEINRIQPSHLVYFANENESFEGDCFVLRTNMATNLYFPWLLASVAEKLSLHFTHFGNTATDVGQETSAGAVKGFTGKMLEYFENTLRLGETVNRKALELITARKAGSFNNNNNI